MSVDWNIFLVNRILGPLIWRVASDRSFVPLLCSVCMSCGSKLSACCLFFWDSRLFLDVFVCPSCFIFVHLVSLLLSRLPWWRLVIFPRVCQVRSSVPISISCDWWILVVMVLCLIIALWGLCWLPFFGSEYLDVVLIPGLRACGGGIWSRLYWWFCAV
jgi:hypothetical protein